MKLSNVIAIAATSYKIKFKMEAAKYTLYPVRGKSRNNRENE